MSRIFGSVIVVLALSSLVACGDANEWSGAVPSPDGALFESQAYPVLMRDCAFSGCHGSSERFFQVFGPGRTRLLQTTGPTDPVTRDEIIRSYDRARAMLAGVVRVESSLLLRKPLEVNAGGRGHEGLDALGRNVYRSAGDAGYLALLTWAKSVGAAPAPAAATAGAMP